VTVSTLSVGLKIEPAANTPEAEVKHAFLSNGHSPILRNSRPGNIRIICKPGKKNCTAVCGVSRNQRDGWYVTYCDVAVGSRCPHAGTELLDAAASLAAGMVVVYGGVWWCMVVNGCNSHAGTELLDAEASLAAGMVVVYGGVWWCMVVIRM
jgi:hypothetical protein